MLKFNLHNVTDTESGEKARIHYHITERGGKKAVVLYAKDYSRELGRLFSDEQYTNNTDAMTDYFEKGHVTILEGTRHYAAALAAAERAAKAQDERWAKKKAKWSQPA